MYSYYLLVLGASYVHAVDCQGVWTRCRAPRRLRKVEKTLWYTLGTAQHFLIQFRLVNWWVRPALVLHFGAFALDTAFGASLILTW
jgi:hypothetical protein